MLGFRINPWIGWCWCFLAPIFCMVRVPSPCKIKRMSCACINITSNQLTSNGEDGLRILRHSSQSKLISCLETNNAMRSRWIPTKLDSVLAKRRSRLPYNPCGSHNPCGIRGFAPRSAHYCYYH